MLFEFSRHVFSNIIHEFSDKLNVTEIGWCHGSHDDSTFNILRENHFLHIVVNGVVEFNGTPVRRGGIAYLKPLAKHDVVYPEGEEGEHYWLSFGGDESDRIISDAGLSDYQFSRVDDSAVDLLSGVLHEAVFGGMTGENRLASKFIGILYYFMTFLQEHQLPDSATGRMTPQSLKYTEMAADFIKYNFHSDIRPSDVADYLGVTEKYLCKLFHAQYGITPEHFLSKMRNDKARRLLRTTSLDVRMIASMCGFNDPTYFARWFKKHNGISATEYRDELKVNSEHTKETLK